MKLLPGAKWEPVDYRLDAGVFVTPPLGWILHVTTGHGDPFGDFENAPQGARKFSHACVLESGVGVQYQDLSYKSWAQADGNPFYWSFETAGDPRDPLTLQQIHTLAAWHVFLGVPDVLAEKPGDKGIGTHYMGGAAWGGHSCPDPSPGVGPRSHQRADILATAARIRSGADMDPKEFVTALANWDVSGLCGEPSPLSFQTAFGRIYKRVKALDAAESAEAPHPQAQG